MASDLTKWEESLSIGSKVDFGTDFSEYPTFTLCDEMTITEISDTQYTLTHIENWRDVADKHGPYIRPLHTYTMPIHQLTK